MMGVQIALERGFHVLIATGEDMDEPRGLISFSNTPLGEEFRSTVLKEKIMISLILTFTVLLALYWFIDLVFILLIILLSDFLVFRNFKSISNLPLAVNLNHPFMESEPVGKSEVMVNFSNKWVDPGIHRLKLVKDALTGWVVHRTDDDLSILSTWDSNLDEAILTKQLAIINQAISLNNAVNESNDEFEDAREREQQDSTLLEREWLPEEEIEVQGPISRIFSPE